MVRIGPYHSLVEAPEKFLLPRILLRFPLLSPSFLRCSLSPREIGLVLAELIIVILIVVVIVIVVSVVDIVGDDPDCVDHGQHEGEEGEGVEPASADLVLAGQRDGVGRVRGGEEDNSSRV